MTTELKKIVFVIALTLCMTSIVLAHWDPCDGHKMHFPQLPNPIGWDIDLRQYWLADDWQCTQTGDVNDIHFWISWAQDEIGTVNQFNVQIYSNDPNPPFSKPYQMLWSRTFPSGQFTVRGPYYGDQGYWIPNQISPTIVPHDHQQYFQINIKDINNAFVQQEGQIYWLALKVMPGQTPYPGWKTSIDHFMDNAVVKYGTTPGWQPLYEPNSTLPIDFAFVITSPTEVVVPEPNVKWLQRPDLSSNGLDVMASVPLILADDFLCTKSTLITDITIWGSWLKDILPPGGPSNVTFNLSIHSDIPASQSPTGHSMPNELLWHMTLPPSEVSIERQDINEGWFDPVAGMYDPNGDHVCWKYVFHIPEANAFCQKGTPENPIVYWLDVQADLGDLNEPNKMPFGWKTSIDHWNDDAVWSFGSEPNIGWWEELTYPYYHPYYPNSIDLAFAIDGNIPCANEPPEPEVKWRQRPDLSSNGLDVMASVPLTLADDFECNKSTLITDITIWGSWLHDILLPGGPNNVWFTLSIHSDIPVDPCMGHYYSMPDEVLWLRNLLPSEVSIEREDVNEGWFDPLVGLYIPIGDHVCWKYVFHIPEADAFCQKGTPENPLVYWLDVQAYFDFNEPNILAPFGWKTSINHWNDDAVWIISGPNEPNATWEELRYPPGHPYYPNSIDLAFAIDGNIPCNIAENELGDAPDSSNNSGVGMTAYPATGVAANYPTVYLTGSPPFGPIHWLPRAAAWLGPWVTLENEADLFPPDEDGLANINPPANSPDNDANDDGVLNMPLVLRYCYPTTFNYQINVAAPAVGLYANVWFDWNRDGDWDDTPVGCGNEWAVQNQFFPAGSLLVGLNTVTSSTFLPWHPTFKEAKIWMRITLSEQPWVSGGGLVGDGGSGPAAGYYYGETEDYFFTPDPNCLFVGRVFSVPCDPTVNLTITPAMIAKWHYLGEPNCWCCDAQKCGNGIYTGPSRNRVDAIDLAALKLAFFKMYTQPGYNPCLDFNLSGRIDAVDLSILKMHFFKATGSSCCL